MAEGKERYADYTTDKADGQVNWAQQGKDAIKDWKAPVSHLSLLCKYLLYQLVANSAGHSTVCIGMVACLCFNNTCPHNSHLR